VSEATERDEIAPPDELSPTARRLITYAMLGRSLRSPLNPCECCGRDGASVHETEDGWDAVSLCSECVQMLESCDYEGDG
jgi:hypothetical protein